MTQEDIAKALKISRRTVARALNGDVRISEETRGIVLTYCESVGYSKNRIGSLLASQKKTVNAYLLISTNEKYLSQTTEGILKAQKQLSDYKIKFNIFSSKIGEPDKQISLIEKSFAKDKPDAVIIIPAAGDMILEAFNELDFDKVVTIDKSLAADITHIGGNYIKFGEIAAQMLQIARREGEKLLVIHTDGDKISSDDFYGGFLSVLESSGAQNYECLFIGDIRNNMDRLLEHKDLKNVKYIFASRFLTEIIDCLENNGHKDKKYIACSINDTLKEHIRNGKVISGININYRLHGFLAAKAAFNMLNSDWKPVHYVTDSQIIIKGNLNNIDDNNAVEMQTMFNIL